MKTFYLIVSIALVIVLTGCQKRKQELVGHWKRTWYTGAEIGMCGSPTFAFHKGNSFTEIIRYCDDQNGRFCVRGETITLTYRFKGKPNYKREVSILKLTDTELVWEDVKNQHQTTLIRIE